ncbi:MAG: O-methyltransferase [Marinomonas sp.]|uniref:O-methyltransferase n=1 Tax=Marinomonas pontica TaxID=264739 RepID=A0ABM8F9U3_9GAMM|nr:O-methyltransferase [Marinomonas pontica]
MDHQIQAVLEQYHQRIQQERQAPRIEPKGGRDGGHDQRMRAVGPDTGQLLNLLVKSLKAPNILEIGTSFGYSGIWLAEAAKATGGRVTTLEMHQYKSDYAKQKATEAGLADYIDFQIGDAVELIQQYEGKFDFILLDLWKDMYVPCLDVFYPKLNPGAIVVADNMIRPGNQEVKDYGLAVRAKAHMSGVLLPVGTGLEISRYEPSPHYNAP